MKHLFPSESIPLQTNIHGGATIVVDVIGDVDMETAPQMQEAINEAMAAAPRVLIIDLTRVTFLASAGLAVLVNTDRETDQTDVRIVATAYIATRTLRLVGLDKVLSIFPTVAAAST
jgi:anti-anti-sigma factor